MTSAARSEMNGSVPRRSTPTHSMVLRSACRVCGCTAGKVMDGRLTPRHNHRHHTHSHSSANKWYALKQDVSLENTCQEEHIKENSTLNANLGSNINLKHKLSDFSYESRNNLVKTPLKLDEFTQNQRSLASTVVTTEVKTIESVEETTQLSSLEFTRRHLFSDYSTGNETSDPQEGTETEYLDAGRNEAANKHSHERLNMSRTRIHGRSAISSARAALHSDSESEGENPIPSIKTKARNSAWHSRHRKFSSSPVSAAFSWSNARQNSSNVIAATASYSHSSPNLNSSNLGNSHYLKQTEGFDMEFSDIDESDSHLKYKGQSRSFSYLSILATIMGFPLVEKVLQCFSWLIWKTIYHTICTVMLIDTWVLSRCSSFGKRKFFLLLIIPLLLWIYGYSWFSRDAIKAASSSPVNVISSAASLLSTLSPSSWLSISSKRIDTGLIKSDLPSDTLVGSETTELHSWTTTLLKSFAGIFFSDSKKVDEMAHETQTLKHSDEIYTDSEYIKKLVQSVFKQELSELMMQFTKQQEFLSSKQTTELSQHSRRLEDLHTQLNSVLLQSQHLSEELLHVKEQLHTQLKQNNFERAQSANKARDAAILENKLEEVESRIYSLQHLIETMKNCCTNFSNYASATESHVADLLMEAMDGDFKGRQSVFADFGSWLQRNFISENTLSERMTVLEDHIKSDVSISVKQQAEDTAKSAASAAVAESIDILKDEVTQKTNTLAGFYATSLSNSHHCTTEDTVKKFIKDAISIYDADKTGLVDYALESAGGSIINTRCSETYQASTGLISMFGIPLWYTTTSPRTVIQPGCHPGQCWSFKGSQGYLVIALSATIQPTAFTLEHIPKSLSPTGSIDSAPKEFSVWGLTKENDLDGTLLGQYEYKKDGDSLQYFSVQNPDPGYFSIVELRIHSNHGNLDYTCLYRFRVHGTN